MDKELAEPEELDVAVRAYAFGDSIKRRRAVTSRWRDLGPSEWSLIFDIETTIDAAQRLRIGAYEIRKNAVLVERGVFHDPDALTPEEAELVTNYARQRGFRVHTQATFVRDVFFEIVWARRGLLIAMNLPFDLTRLAVDHAVSRPKDKSMRGGFSLVLTRDPFLPNIQLKRINSRAAFIRLTTPKGRHPEQRNRQRGGDVANHNGYFIDIATCAAAMLSFRGSLGDLAEVLGTSARKKVVEKHGEELSGKYLDYLLADVAVTWECYEALRDIYESWGLTRTPLYRIMSEASIGKAYLREMNVQPQPLQEWPPHVLAAVMETYHGGRTETRIRKVSVPGTYVDFMSEYPTVFVLMKLWPFMISERVDWVIEDPVAISELVRRLTIHDLLDPSTWSMLTVIVQVTPDGDLLPTRAQFGSGTTYNVALCYRTGGPAQYYTLADVVASKIATGRVPRIERAIRFEPKRVQGSLRTIAIAGNAEYAVDPLAHDLVKRLVDLRRGIRAQARDRELDALAQGLKIAANSVAYGIAIEVNTIEHSKRPLAKVHLPDGNAYESRVSRTEEPGRWFNPVIATLVAAGGRLLLAMVIRLVHEAGGTYAFCDTDSLFIISKGQETLIPCAGGPYTVDGQQAIKALSWDCVDEIVARFQSLNPFHGDGRSILAIETDNFDSVTGQHREIHCYSIASKRYAFHTYEGDRPLLLGMPGKRKRSEHGLGHLLPPIPSSRSDWYDSWWQRILDEEAQMTLDEPDWFHLPAVSKVTVTSPREEAAFRGYNRSRGYEQRVRPWNFLLRCRRRFPEEGSRTLVAPFENRPDSWLSALWFDRTQPDKSYRIKVDRALIVDTTVPVETYGDYFADFLLHPESKATYRDGKACHPWTKGLLGLRVVRAMDVARIGKEANRLTDLSDVEKETSAVVYQQRRCQVCGISLSSSRASYCSNACRQKAYRMRRKPFLV